MYVDDDDEDGYLDYENDEGFQRLASRGGSYAGTNGQSSWLEYEDQIEDWLGITTLTSEKWGSSLKNALVGPAEHARQPEASGRNKWR